MPRGWMSGWRGKRGEEGRREGEVNLLGRASPCFLSYCMGALLPPRLAHSAPWRLEEQGSRRISLCPRCFGYISLRDDAFVLLRD